MRRILLFLPLLLLACRAFSLPGGATLAPPSASPTFSRAPATLPLPSPSPAPSVTAAPSASPTTTPETAAPGTPSPPLLSGEAFTLRFHPDGPLYVGDQVSLEVISPPDVDLSGRQVEVQAASAGGQAITQASFAAFGIGERSQATLSWFWDTRGLPPGVHQLSLSVQPDGIAWSVPVELLPADQAPPPEPQAAWAMAETDCCLVYYITGTEAERDLIALLAMVDAQSQDAVQKLGVELEQAIPLVLLPRVLGHGGFAAEELAVSYLDRNYAGGLPEMVVHHEMVHLLDGRLGGEFRPSILVEGLAVYLSGGHFKPEALTQRAAALLPAQAGCQELGFSPAEPGTGGMGEPCGLGWYIPLQELTDSFYLSQHETGYLQAGALVEFMVQSWGWQAFSTFYRDIEPPGGEDGGSNAQRQSGVFEAALQKHFGLSLAQLEERFRQYLQQETLSAPDYWDVLLSVQFYETVRRYQEELDPSAYFLTAWLPGSRQMRENGILADYLRRPTAPQNLELEDLLVEANAAMLRGDYAAVQEFLLAVNHSLDALATVRYFSWKMFWE